MFHDDYFGNFKEKSEQTVFMKEDTKTVRFDPVVASLDDKKHPSNPLPSSILPKPAVIELSDKKSTSSAPNKAKKFLEPDDLQEIKKNIAEETKEAKKKSRKVKVPPINEIENVLLRRFSVKIRDIKFHNLQKDYLTIFLQFIIGKDVAKETYVTPLGRQTKYLQTTSGLRFKSELLKAVEHGELRNVNVLYENEYRASYDMLEEENLTIQVWSYNRWRVNTFMGKYSLSLDRVANDSITKAVAIKMQGSGKKVLGRVYFTGYFQEIWDWKISFSDWKGFNFVKKNGTPLTSRLYLTLRTKEVREPTVSSNSVKRNANPSFDEIKGNILFRGTLDEFENHFLLITVKTNEKTVQKSVSLRGISQTMYLKSTIKLFDPKDDKENLFSRLKLHKSGNPASTRKLLPPKKAEDQPEIMNPDEEKDADDHFGDSFEEERAQASVNEEEGEEEDDEAILQQDKDMIYITIEGRVSLNNTPRFKQKGELIRFKKNERYLVVLVNRVEAVMAPDDRNRIDSFVSVNWGGNEKFTQTFYDSTQPDYNEELVFRLPGKFSKKNERLDALKEELNSRSEIIFNLWIENDDGSNESVGCVKFKLSELMEAQKEEKVYQEYYTGRKIKAMCRSSVITKSFNSATVDSPNTKIVAQICFFPDIPDKIDLRTLKYDAGDRFPREVSELVNQDVQEGDYYGGELFRQWDHMLKKNFMRMPLEKVMAKVFLKYIFVKDQYGRQHMVSKYIGRYTIEDRKN